MDAAETETTTTSVWHYTLDRSAVDVTVEMVRRLLTEQFPALASLAIEPLTPWGTDNAMFRLGPDLVVRVPRSGWAKDGVEKEVRWLPSLGAQLPVSVPEVVGVGAPDAEYPWTWAIYRWIPGARPSAATLRDGEHLPVRVAEFLMALREVTIAGGPAPGPHNGYRGGPAAARDRWVRPTILAGEHGFDRDELMAFWDGALASGPPVAAKQWLHGDLTPTNLLVANTHLVAVIDWGCLAVGDAACDLMLAWNLDDPGRARLREELAVDDATWARGRAAAFWQWIGGANADPDNEARRVVARVLADYRAGR